jgi:homoserine kinase
MRKVRITLPASLTNLGPGTSTLGLALGLHTTVEISERADNQLIVDTEGEGSGRYSTGLRHPVTLALIRIFQKLERAPVGIHIKINNQIPLDSGLGAESAFLAAGVIGANNLLGGAYTREHLLEIAAQISKKPDSVIASLLGGLTTGLLDGDQLVYKTLPVKSLRVVVALPELDDYPSRSLAPERVPLADALYNLQRVPLLIEALRTGDMKLIGKVLDDRLNAPFYTPRIFGYKQATEIARRAGALAVTLSGDGPALVAFAEVNHSPIAEAMVAAFESVGVKARSWVLPIDTQGVVISVVQSA